MDPAETRPRPIYAVNEFVFHIVISGCQQPDGFQLYFLRLDLILNQTAASSVT
jgi:hypothetical protein